MSHSQFHCTGRAYLDMHGLIFETSICYWQDQPGRGASTRRARCAGSRVRGVGGGGGGGPGRDTLVAGEPGRPARRGSGGEGGGVWSGRRAHPTRTGPTWERVEREVGGGIGMGKTCKPKPVSFQCMTKFTTNKKKKKKNAYR